jgi:hypothetical protein
MINLRAVNKLQFDNAKDMWSLSLVFKLVVYVVGLYTVLTKSSWFYTPLIVLFISIASELAQWRSDYIKSQAESLLRKLDICRSFGKEISDVDKRDIIANVPRAVRKTLEDDGSPDTYFDSSSDAGPKRAVENLVASAWYTRRQSSIMAVVYIVLFLLLVAVSVVGLIVAAKNVDLVDAKAMTTKVVTSWLMLIFTLSIFKNSWGYYKMYQRCQKTEAAG